MVERCVHIAKVPGSNPGVPTFMVITPHLLAGAVVGVNSPGLFSAFILGLLSHYILDFIPHWDYINYIDLRRKDHLIKIFFDFVLGLFPVLVLTSFNFSLVLWAALFASLLPDFLEVGYNNLGFKFLKPISLFHERIHRWQGLSFWRGFAGNFMVITGSIIVLWLWNNGF